MITVVLTIVVIIILAAIGIATSSSSLDEAAVTKFKHEITEVKRGVEVVKLANSKTGIDEATINKSFRKVKVINPPNNFVSFDNDELTAYLIDLHTIDYEKLKTGKKYKEINNDTVTFDVDDVYIYDKLGTVFYVKGLYIEGNEKIYTADEKTLEGPIVTAENTENGIVEVIVTPTKNGEITSVTVGGKTATKKDDEENVFIAEVEKNGSYIVTATETTDEGSESSKTTVIVTKIEEDEDSGDVTVAPTIASIKINNGEAYVSKEKATIHIETDAKYMYIKHVTDGTMPTVPTATDSGWKRAVDSTEIYLSEGNNEVFAWFRNSGNDTILEADMQSTILDTRAPTRDAPTVQIFDEHSFRITCNQRDPAVGSGLMRIDIGYKLSDSDTYTWVNVEDIENPTIEVTNNKPNKNYKIITRAQDNVGHVSESVEYDTGKLNNIPGGIVIENNPTEGWTKRSTVVITYPDAATGIYEKWYRLAGGEWKLAEDKVETIYIEENMIIDAVVVKKTNGETLFGKMASKEIKNIDNIPPEIGKVILDSEAGEVNDTDFRGTTTITDEGSGLVAYVVGASETEPTTWHYLQEVTNEETISFDVNIDTQTYIWVKDLAGNVAYTTVEVEYVDMTNEKITATLDQTEYIYTSKEIVPEPNVKDGTRVLKKDKHYEVKYENNINVGTATITITGKRAYKGEIKMTFTIKPYTPTVILNNKTANYNRNPISIDAPTFIVPTGAETPTGAITYTYYIDSALTTKTTSVHGATTTGGAPSKENTYYVVANLAAAGNYTEATSNTATLIISACPVEVTFEPNGGTTTETKRIMYLDKTYGNNGNLPAPTRTGYDFLGWYTATTGGTQVTESTVVTSQLEHSIYAQWELLNVAPSVPTVTLSSKTTSSFILNAVSTDVNGDNLVYKLYVDEVLISTSAPTTSGTSITLNATGLSEYTNYTYYVSVSDGMEAAQSSPTSVRTYCSGQKYSNSNECNIQKVECTECNGKGIENGCKGLVVDHGNVTTCSECGSSNFTDIYFTCTKCEFYGRYHYCTSCGNEEWYCINCGHGDGGDKEPDEYLYSCTTKEWFEKLHDIWGGEECSACDGTGFSHCYCITHNSVDLNSSTQKHCAHGYTSLHD